jgi:hypothetical protein
MADVDGARLDLGLIGDSSAVTLLLNSHSNAPSLVGRWRSASTRSAKAAEDWRRLGRTREDCIEQLCRPVEGQLAFHAHPEFAGALLKLPGVQAAGRQTQIDAVVPDQILRPVGLRVDLKIGGRHGHAHIGPDAHCDHVLRDLLPAADASIILLRDDVG